MPVQHSCTFYKGKTQKARVKMYVHEQVKGSEITLGWVLLEQTNVSGLYLAKLNVSNYSTMKIYILVVYLAGFSYVN